MATLSHTNSSETLKHLQWEQPTNYQLKERIYSLLEQFSTPDTAKRLIENSKLWLLLDDTEKLAQETWDKLAALKIETMITARASAYQTDLELLTSKVPQDIHEILLAA